MPLHYRSWRSRPIPLIVAEMMLALLSPTAATATAEKSTAPATSDWATLRSDIPLDPAWKTGTLANGVRYAVRRGEQPKGSLSIRVRVDAGALAEMNDEQGWSHLLEHLLFRGTSNFPDGEAVRTWQRLGASFGKDTNASTTLTATTYQVDLPRNDPASYAQSLAILAEMMSKATLSREVVEAERRVVLAESASRLPPTFARIDQAQRHLMLAGTKAGTRNLIGTPETLAKADTDSLRKFYHRWYRPSRTTVVVVGDADPAMLEKGIRSTFEQWRATGPEPLGPDYGAPREPERLVAVVHDSQAPVTALVGYVTAHDDEPFTVARQRLQFANLVATGLLNQRLATEAQKGEALINAHVGRVEQQHVADQMILQLQYRRGQWKEALAQAYRLLNGIVANPPTAAEIEQQFLVLHEELTRQAAAAPSASSDALANAFVRNVDQGDITGEPSFYRDLFAAQRPTLDPAAISAALRRLFAPEPRLLLLSPDPIEGDEAAAVAELATARRAAAVATGTIGPVSLDGLRIVGSPATIETTKSIAKLGIERVRFANGVELRMRPSKARPGSMSLEVLAGHGVLGQPVGNPGLFWTAPALLASGIGPFTPDEVERLSAGHQYRFTVRPTVDALVLSGESRDEDLPGMLKLMTGLLSQPRFSPASVERVRESVDALRDSVLGQPLAVFQSLGAPNLYGGDPRFTELPSAEAVRGLTTEAFENFWRSKLAEAPLRVIAVGDFDRDRLVAAVAATLGTLPARSERAPVAVRPVAVARTALSQIVLHHRSTADQAVAVQAFPTIGETRDGTASKALALTATIIQSRLNEELRARLGSTYAPFSFHLQVAALPDYGMFVAGAQIDVAHIPQFENTLAGIITDLAARGPDRDAFERASATAISTAHRQQSEDGYWAAVLHRDLDNPDELIAIETHEGGWSKVTSAQVADVARRYLMPARATAIHVVPEH